MIAGGDKHTIEVEFHGGPRHEQVDTLTYGDEIPPKISVFADGRQHSYVTRYRFNHKNRLIYRITESDS